MKRRHFLKKIPAMAGATMALNNVPIRAFSNQSPFLRLAQQSNNDRVLVIIQLHGGNDGLNSVIPVDQYELYYQQRPNIAIPKRNSIRNYIELDSTLALDARVGLHPDMIGAKDLYDRGRMAIVQGVSYPNNNGSHFRGRDIWFMGGGFENYYDSGWAGRYLQQEYVPDVYPDDFPNDTMPDPLAIELGSDVSLLFHQPGNIPTSISLPGNPETFIDLVNGLQGFEDNNSTTDPIGVPPEHLTDSPYYKELDWILGLEDKTKEYAERLYDVYVNNGTEATVTYPEIYPFNAPLSSKNNNLAGQLRIVSRLIAGGAKTKVYLLRIGGFDTHAGQVESYDPTMGAHAALMYHLSSAMNAFQKDLASRGIEDRVLSVTTSEFGRRIKSNGSYGTDHGTGGPLFLFGRGVKPGVVGVNHNFMAQTSNIAMQYDYRQVFANLLKDWMLVDEEVIDEDIFFGDFINGNGYQPLPLAQQQITGITEFFDERYQLKDAYPNPVSSKKSVTIPYRINTTSNVLIKILDQKGRTVKTVENSKKGAGDHTIKTDLTGIKPGLYFYQIEAGLLKRAKKLVITN